LVLFDITTDKTVNKFDGLYLDGIRAGIDMEKAECIINSKTVPNL
jgi:hypothetical protein